MRILLTANHRYPATHSPGWAGGRAGYRVLDNLVKGLAELGHDIVYQLQQGAGLPLPHHVRLAPDAGWNPDIIQIQDRPLTESIDVKEPWVRSCHADLALRGLSRSYARDNWIFVSRTLAQSYGRSRYVLNGIDPSEYDYSEQKGNYLLFMCDLSRAMEKGVDIAIALAGTTSVPLVIAGSTNCHSTENLIRDLARDKPITLVGEVRGKRKAELLAGAKAILFPTRVNESFGLVIAEALMSGTPVIASNYGACPELVTADVGFVCSDMTEFIHAIDQVGDISREACRRKAMAEFHYLRMARDYVKEYEIEVGGSLHRTNEADGFRKPWHELLESRPN
jgi:glycosyltransferase involved in cell wall biosynthesis